jgi:hypothetical protein
MNTALDTIAGAFESATDAWRACPDFYKFEPWDVAERPRDVMDTAMRDGADLFAPQLVSAVGNPPHGFQADYLLDMTFGRVILSAGRIGKSLMVLMEILMSATGEIPFALRYPKGVDTGIPREVNDDNIFRWGRRSKETGEILDRDTRAIRDGTWDCGNVIGVGVFPSAKIVPSGSMIRLASYDSIIKQVWFPAFTGDGGSPLARFVPRAFIQTQFEEKNKSGFHVQERWVMLKRNVRLQMITYEAKKKSFEGAEPPAYLDEEPPDEELLGSLWTHCSRWSLSETPWRGITYSQNLAFPESRSPMRRTYHATLYDCPYKTPQKIAEMRGELANTPWEIVARVWGIPADVQGKPYYDRMKINLWLQKWKRPFRKVQFIPVREWDRIRTDTRVSRLPGLMQVDVKVVDVDAEDKRTVWRLYEDRADGVAYGAASDQAEGAENVADVADWNTCVIGRQRDVAESPTAPVVCATIRSALPTSQFAREVLYAARYFNNALLIPEASKGSANGTFEEVCKDWPYWFLDVVERWSTGRPKEFRGFCPTKRSRELLYDKLLRDWFDTYDETQYPEIPDEWILREAAGAVVGTTKGKTATRCDHTRDGGLDSLTSMGILMYAMQKEYLGQWKCRGGGAAKAKSKTWLDLAEEAVHGVGRGVYALGAAVERLR